MLPQVYAISGAPETWEQRLFAAVLWAGEATAAGGRSAAALWGFPGFGRPRIEIVNASKKSVRGVYVRRSTLDARDVTRVRVFPVTTPGRTLVDLSPDLDHTRFDALFHYCLHHRLATWEGFHGLASRLAGCRGTAKLRAALDAYAPGGAAAASALEARLARRICEAMLPAPVRQHPVDLPSGRRFLDFAWPDERVALEVDGYRWHSSRTAWERDRARIAELRRAGWRIVQATYADVVRGFDQLVTELRTLLSV